MNEPTVVIFRRWPKKEGGGVVAIFPNDPGTNDPYTCSAYEHHGQHASCDPNGMMRRTKPAKESDADVQELKRELENYGPPDAHYNLVVRQRLDQKYLRNRIVQLSSPKNPGLGSDSDFPDELCGVLIG